MLFSRLLAVVIITLLSISCKKKTYDRDPQLPMPLDTLLGWQRINLVDNQTITDVNFLNKSTGFITTTNGISKSIDSGKTWTKVYSKTNGYSNFFRLSSNSFFVNDWSNFGYSFDGGVTWSNIPFNTFSGKDIFFTSASTGYITSEQGLHKTSDTGKTWQRAVPYNTNGIWFKNSGQGICYANNYIQTSSTGFNWTQLYNLSIVSLTNELYTICFTDNNIGWMSAHNKIYKTTDGGTIWATQTRPHNISDIHFLTDQIGFYSTQDEIYKTTNGGNTWTRISKVGGYQQIIEIFFIDENNGWACGTDGLFLRFRN